MKNFFKINKKPLRRHAQTAILTMALLFVLYEKTNACSANATYYISLPGETWTAGTIPAGFTGQEIVVPDGATFIIDGCTLSFMSGAGISNSPASTTTSHLEVIDGSILQGCSGGDWRGIYFQGIANAPGGNYTEYDADLNPSTSQNTVRIESSTIQDAELGVHIFEHAMLNVSLSTFLDNTVGILIDDASEPDYYYPVFLSSTTYMPAASVIETSTFNINNVNMSDPNMDLYVCIRLISTPYLEIEDNTFECTHAVVTGWTDADDRAIGISGTDANFSLHPTGAYQNMAKCLSYTGTGNVFKWLGTGVSTTNTGSVYNTYTIHVRESTFQECFHAMMINGGWFHTIENNYTISFDPTQSSASSYWSPGIATDISDGIQYLVELNGASDFIFYSNDFFVNMYNTIFLGVINSGDHPTLIENNAFNSYGTSVASNATFEAAVYFSGENSKEDVTANAFVTNHKYGIATDNSGTMPLGPFGNAANGVQNTFGGSNYAPGYNLYNSGSGTINYYSYSPDGSTLNTYNFSGILASVDNPLIIEDCKEWPLAPQGGGGVNEGYGSIPDMRVYPNPANSQLVFDLSAVSGVRGAIVTTVDVLGKVIGSYNYDDMGSKLVVNTSGYDPGVYIYRFTMNGNMENTGKFEVNH